MDLISIIMPMFMCEDYLAKSIESVINQSYKNWELIIVDDCGTDNSRNVAETYAQNYCNIEIITNSENLGAAYSRNNGIQCSKGRYICFLDSDDVWMPDKLYKQYNYMRRNELPFSYTNYSRIDETGNVLKERLVLAQKSNRMLAMCEMPMLTSTVMLDTMYIPKDHIRFPNITSSEDRACFSSILKEIDFAFLCDEILTLYRVRDKSISHDSLKNIRRTWRYYRTVENLSLIQASGCFVRYVCAALKKRF